MDFAQLVSLVVDIALGGLALNLSLNLQKTVKVLASGHSDLANRVSRLERHEDGGMNTETR